MGGTLLLQLKMRVRDGITWHVFPIEIRVHKWEMPSRTPDTAFCFRWFWISGTVFHVGINE